MASDYVDPRQASVEKHDVGLLVLNHCECRVAIACFENLDLAPLPGEAKSDRFDDVRFVVDDADLYHGDVSPRSGSISPPSGCVWSPYCSS